MDSHGRTFWDVLAWVLTRPLVLIAFILVCLGSWAIVHFAAAPGTQISILAGLIQYTKPPAVEAQTAPVKVPLDGAAAPQPGGTVQSLWEDRPAGPATDVIRAPAADAAANTADADVPAPPAADAAAADAAAAAASAASEQAARPAPPTRNVATQRSPALGTDKRSAAEAAAANSSAAAADAARAADMASEAAR